MKEIPLTQGRVALVDDEDFEALSKYKWCFTSQGSGYAVRFIGHTPVYMHREILSVEPGLHVDHIDGNGLNNTRSNLRPATPSQNQHNRGAQRNNKSGYKGVYWDTSKNRWRARIKANGKVHYLGRYKTPEEAAQAYNLAASRYFGEFARLNEIPA